MGNFDIAIGISESNMNSLASTLYHKVYPDLFKDSKTVDYAGSQITVKYDIQEAPQFDFSVDCTVVIAESNQLQQERQSGTLTAEEQTLLNELLAHVPTFQVNLPKVYIELDGAGISTKFDLSLHIYAVIEISGDKANLKPFKITADSTGSQVEDVIVQQTLIPQMMRLAEDLLNGVQIPSLSFANAEFSTLAIQILNGQILAVSNLKSKGAAEFPTDQSFPKTDFFAMLSRDVFQVAASGTTKQFGGSDSKGVSGFSAHYDATFTMHDPNVSINGDGLDIAFQVETKIGAGVEVFWSDIGLCYSGSATPTPTAHTVLQYNGSSNMLNVIASSISTFTFLVTPCGSISTQVLSWMTEFIVSGIVAAASAGISSTLKDINITAFKVPSYPINITGHNMTAEPTDITVSNFDGYLSLGGQLAIS